MSFIMDLIQCLILPSSLMACRNYSYDPYIYYQILYIMNLACIRLFYSFLITVTLLYWLLHQQHQGVRHKWNGNKYTLGNNERMETVWSWVQGSKIHIVLKEPLEEQLTIIMRACTENKTVTVEGDHALLTQVWESVIFSSLSCNLHICHSPPAHTTITSCRRKEQCEQLLTTLTGTTIIKVSAEILPILSTTAAHENWVMQHRQVNPYKCPCKQCAQLAKNRKVYSHAPIKPVARGSSFPAVPYTYSTTELQGVNILHHPQLNQSNPHLYPLIIYFHLHQLSSLTYALLEQDALSYSQQLLMVMMGKLNISTQLWATQENNIRTTIKNLVLNDADLSFTQAKGGITPMVQHTVQTMIRWLSSKQKSSILYILPSVAVLSGWEKEMKEVIGATIDHQTNLTIVAALPQALSPLCASLSSINQYASVEYGQYNIQQNILRHDGTQPYRMQRVREAVKDECKDGGGYLVMTITHEQTPYKPIQKPTQQHTEGKVELHHQTKNKISQYMDKIEWNHQAQGWFKQQQPEQGVMSQCQSSHYGYMSIYDGMRIHVVNGECIKYDQNIIQWGKLHIQPHSTVLYQFPFILQVLILSKLLADVMFDVVNMDNLLQKHIVLNDASAHVRGIKTINYSYSCLFLSPYSFAAILSQPPSHPFTALTYNYIPTSSSVRCWEGEKKLCEYLNL